MNIPQTETANQKLLRSKLFWVGILYFAEGFPLGVFYDVFPVHFRTLGVELWKIGFMSLLGLSWTLKFLWAPAIDHFRRHRRWMFAADMVMALIMVVFAYQNGFGAWVWWLIGLFTIMSATNDVAIDGYTIEMLNKGELGVANGLRIGFYRVGMLASGFVLMLADVWGWTGTYLTAALLFLVTGVCCLLAPREMNKPGSGSLSIGHELKALVQRPAAAGSVILFLIGALWLADRSVKWSDDTNLFWPTVFLVSATFLLGVWLFSHNFRRRAVAAEQPTSLTEGPMFGTLLSMLRRPHIVAVVVFVLTFKLGDSAMGFMIKPFWVDAGFSAAQIGLVSVNIGLGLSIAGGIAGGWYTDRVGIFRALWVLGLWQAFSNLGYAYAANTVPLAEEGYALDAADHWLMYAASAIESFTGGLGTAAFLAFLMAIVNKQHAATEYAILSSIFALSRSLAGWAGGFGAHSMGYADYFLLTFFLAFPAYLLLPWAKRMMQFAEQQKTFGQH
jgi:PAT family beta-lactamase induction signal transducer AmpG